jgi:hypothetical protein
MADQTIEASSGSPSSRSVEAEFSWQAHPARERTGHAVAGSVVILAVGGLVFLLLWVDGSSAFMSALAAFLAIVLLIVSLRRFFFPSSFRIDPEGITARSLVGSARLRWEQIRRFAYNRHGAFLSTRARASWLDAYRGMHIVFGDDRAMILDRIRARLPEGAGSWDR